MITYNLMNSGSDSLYAYLCKSIKGDILHGTLKPGERLPSKRTFASNLGVSVVTVENAYAQLIAEGYIYSHPKTRVLCRRFQQFDCTAAKRDTGVFRGENPAHRRRQLVFRRLFQQPNVF